MLHWFLLKVLDNPKFYCKIQPNTTMKLKHTLLPLLGLMLFATANAATTLTYNFDTILSGATPNGSPSWGSAIVKEIDTNSVSITVGSRLIPDQFFSEINLNLKTGVSITGVSVSNIYSQVGSFTAPTTTLFASSNNAGPAHIGSSIKFAFATNNTTPDSTRFNGVDEFTYTVTGLNINNFEVTAGVPPNFEQTSFVGHIQNVNGQLETSTWVGGLGVPSNQVPEPTSALLGSIGVLALLRRNRQ